MKEQTLITSTTTKTIEDLKSSIGKSLGSPINAKQDGDIFSVTMTGLVNIREFDDIHNPGEKVKKAYFTTNEGYVILITKYNSHLTFTGGEKMTCMCKISNINSKEYKYAQFVLLDATIKCKATSKAEWDKYLAK